MILLIHIFWKFSMLSCQIHDQSSSVLTLSLSYLENWIQMEKKSELFLYRKYECQNFGWYFLRRKIFNCLRIRLNRIPQPENICPRTPGYATIHRSGAKIVVLFFNSISCDIGDVHRQGFITAFIPGHSLITWRCRKIIPRNQDLRRIPVFTSYFGYPKFPLFSDLLPEVRHMWSPEIHRFPSGNFMCFVPGEGLSFSCPARAW